MTNQANIDINIDDAAVEALVRSLTDLTEVLGDLQSGFQKAGRAAEGAERDLDKIEKELF